MNDVKTIYEKLQNVRVELSKAGLKKSGKNKFSNFEYFELPDFLPKSDELCLLHRLTPIFNYVDDMATLTLYDWDSDKTLTWSTNGADATTLNKQGEPVNLEIQSLGSKHTYLKRYLYMHLMNVVEADSIDKNTGNPDNVPNKPTKKQVEPPIDDKPKIERITEDQIYLMRTLYGHRIEGMLKHYKLKSLSDMDTVSAEKLIEIERNKNSEEKAKEQQTSLKDL